MGKDGGGGDGGGCDLYDSLAELKPGYNKMMSDRKKARERSRKKSPKFEPTPFTFMGFIKAVLNLE